jgi:hypothetical protein
LIEEDGLRGGVAGSSLSTNLPIQVVVPAGGGGCINPAVQPNYDNWVAAGRPDCWCFQRHCRGDIDGGLNGPYHVGFVDLNDMLDYLNKFEFQLATVPGYPILNNSGLDFNCANINHLIDGPYRVGFVDLNELLKYLNTFDIPAGTNVPVCPMTDVLTWTN